MRFQTFPAHPARHRRVRRGRGTANERKWAVAGFGRAGPTILDATCFSTPNRRRLSGPGLLTFVAIADLWHLTERERLLVLGVPSRSTYHGWVKAARDGRDLIHPTAILGIHKALQILFLTEPEGIAWLRGPHQSLPFAGQPPMALVTGGTQDGLMAVRRFLDAARGGQWMAPNAADHNSMPITDDDIVFA